MKGVIKKLTKKIDIRKEFICYKYGDSYYNTEEKLGFPDNHIRNYEYKANFDDVLMVNPVSRDEGDSSTRNLLHLETGEGSGRSAESKIPLESLCSIEELINTNCIEEIDSDDEYLSTSGEGNNDGYMFIDDE